MNELKEKSDILSDLLLSDNKNISKIEDMFGEFKVEYFDTPQENLNKLNGTDERQDSIGIWKKRNIKGETIFQRNEDRRHEWHAWANVHEIPLRTNKKRIAFLGESVARGFFYSPKYSVANELQSVLTATPVFDDVEVVDLSKNAMEMDEVIDIVKSCELFSPDLMVMFAGNNWLSKLYEELNNEDYLEILSLYDDKGFSSVKSYLENKFEKIVSRFIDLVIATNEKNKTSTIFVIPAFNLFNWRSDDYEKTISQLNGDNLIKWLEAKNRAELALMNKDYENLELESDRMIQLDSSNPYGYELLSEAYIAKGQISEAIRCLDDSKDTVLFGRALNSSPRCFKIIRETILKVASRKGVQVVDLSSIFNGMYEDQSRRKDLFLDYCHLSSNGIKIAMKHTAKTVLEHFTGQKIDITTISDSRVSPENLTKSIAHFAAAIHNAHWSQPREILDFHCGKAIEFDESIKTLMLLYADLSSRKSTNELCSSFEEIILEGSMHQFEGGLAFLHPRGEKMMDLDLIDAIVNSIKSLGLDYENELKELRLSQHGVTEVPTNLLEPFYSANGYNKTNDKVSRNFFQVRFVQRAFNFISDGMDDLQVRMCYRNLPGIYENKIKIYLNIREEAINQIDVREEWNTISFNIKKDNIKSGVNKLILEWPIPLGFKKNNYSDHISLNNFFPVLGDISLLTIAII